MIELLVEFAREGPINKRQNKPTEKLEQNVVDEKEEDEITEGPGYMGWNIPEKDETTAETGQDYDSKLKELKMVYSDLKKEFALLKEEVKEFRQQSKELKSIKTEYKECVEALRKETHQRTKAETTVKVLKDIIETQEELQDSSKKSSNDTEDMEIDEALGEWVQQQKRKPIKIPKVTKKSHKCETCGKDFEDKDKFGNHMEIHKQDVLYPCKKCNL